MMTCDESLEQHIVNEHNTGSGWYLVGVDDPVKRFNWHLEAHGFTTPVTAEEAKLHLLSGLAPDRSGD